MDANWVSLKLILATALFLSSSAYALKVTTREVEVGKTANVSLECISKTPPSVSEIVTMRILKLDNDKWDKMAEVRPGGAAKVKQKSKDDKVFAEGTIGSVSDSFLRLTWPVETYDTIGRYRCDVVSISSQKNVEWQKSLPVSVTHKTASINQIVGETLEGAMEFYKQEKDTAEKMTATEETHETGFENKFNGQTQLLSYTEEENKKECPDKSHSGSWQNVTASVKALGEGFDSKLKSLIQVLNRKLEEEKEEKKAKATLEDEKRNPPRQKDLATTVEAFGASVDRQLTALQSLIQPQTCVDVTGLGPRPVVRLTNGMLVVCDTVTDNGGWIVIQRRASADIDFFRGWTDYKLGFGDLSGNFWFGLEKIHQLTHEDRYELRFDLIFKGKHYYARYDTFSLSGESDNYRLQLSGFSGNATNPEHFIRDTMSDSKGQPFSTRDRDHDSSAQSCARGEHSAWWYNKSKLCQG
ncbi:fibroleukin-like [Aplysia californica]|uniref:Fibroleukin-like n=1 Tax=Aplysia californica TaxID=6500 RepID=A0ABM0K4B7_APLCA|nr:fibroleukin-like [Aplysia californica]